MILLFLNQVGKQIFMHTDDITTSSIPLLIKPYSILNIGY